MKRKPHPRSQKEKSFSLGTFGTHTAGFKCFHNTRFRSFSEQCIRVTEIIDYKDNNAYKKLQDTKPSKGQP
ncbi:hypothetical protein COL0001_13810 [Helicobacter pylori]